MRVQNSRWFGWTVQEISRDDYWKSFFRCNYQVSCIWMLRRILETSWSIELKIHRHTHLHVLQHWYEFRWIILSSIRDMRDLVIFLYISLLEHEHKMAAEKHSEGWFKIRSWVHQCGCLMYSRIYDSIMNHILVNTMKKIYFKSQNGRVTSFSMRV